MLDEIEDTELIAELLNRGYVITRPKTKSKIISKIKKKITEAGEEYYLSDKEAISKKETLLDLKQKEDINNGFMSAKEVDQQAQVGKDVLMDMLFNRGKKEVK